MICMYLYHIAPLFSHVASRPYCTCKNAQLALDNLAIEKMIISSSLTQSPVSQMFVIDGPPFFDIQSVASGRYLTVWLVLSLGPL